MSEHTPSFKLPRIIGHRGAAAYAPENTLKGIRTAHDMGVEWVEIDVKLTKDDIPVIFHDDTLDRTTNGSGLLAVKTLEELRDFDCGSWFGDSWAGEEIPTLEEALETIMELGMGLNLEIKPCPGRDKETAEIALDVLSRIWEGEQLLISSFTTTVLEISADMAPDYRRSYLLESEWPPNWQEIANYLEVSTINIDGNAATREQIEAIIDYNKPILAYTINNAQTARRLQRWGVDGFFSDCPDILQDILLTLH